MHFLFPFILKKVCETSDAYKNVIKPKIRAWVDERIEKQVSRQRTCILCYYDIIYIYKSMHTVLYMICIYVYVNIHASYIHIHISINIQARIHEISFFVCVCVFRRSGYWCTCLWVLRIIAMSCTSVCIVRSSKTSMPLGRVIGQPCFRYLRGESRPMPHSKGTASLIT